MTHKKRILYIILSLYSLIGFSQHSSYYNKDSSIIYLPTTIDSIVMDDYFIPTRCKNDLSDSLSLLIKSLQDQVFATTYDSTISYAYQFTKINDIEINFQSKLSRNHECFVIESQRNINEFFTFNEYILCNKNKWLIVKINGIPHFGNSTYITDSYLYFKKN